MVNLATFSDAVLDFQAIAQQKAVDRFQEAALDRLQKVLPFDRAWWGIMSAQGESFDLHCSLPFGLPDTWLPMWEELKGDDAVAQAVRNHPRVTAHFDSGQLASVPGLRLLTREHDIGEALCTSIYLPSDRSFVFLSLYRSFHSSAFDASDRELNQFLMPHLCASWTANRQFQMECMKASVAQDRIALALVDRHGPVLNAESGFPDLMAVEWPSARSDALPVRVADWFRSGEEVLKLARIVLHRHPIGELSLIAARPRTAADSLSTRESQIARAFSHGASYKEIARTMDLSPATVRHHLRAVYLKLEVGDKAQMTSLLHASDFFLESEELLHRYRTLQHTPFA